MHTTGFIVPWLLSFVFLSVAVPINTDLSVVHTQLLQKLADTHPLPPGLSSNGNPNSDFSHIFLSDRSLPAMSVGGNWYLFFEQYIWATPTHLAVERMLVFYNALQAEAAARGPQDTSASSIQFGKGNLRLLISCERPLSWLFLENFANWMLGATNQGFAGLYTARVVDAASGLTITITLQLLAAVVLPN